jgi:general secretion pathway protein I
MRRSEAGFTLLEVMVAFVISALALAVLFNGTTTGLRATEQAGKYVEAISLVQSHLAALGDFAAGNRRHRRGWVCLAFAHQTALHATTDLNGQRSGK